MGKERARESEEAVAARVAALRTTILELQRERDVTGSSFTCFTSTKVQIRTGESGRESEEGVAALHYTILELYYRSTNTDATNTDAEVAPKVQILTQKGASEEGVAALRNTILELQSERDAARGEEERTREQGRERESERDYQALALRRTISGVH